MTEMKIIVKEMEIIFGGLSKLTQQRKESTTSRTS
jgi:hypothetical protein